MLLLNNETEDTTNYNTYLNFSLENIFKIQFYVANPLIGIGKKMA